MNIKTELYFIDHATNTILAFVFGRRKDVVFKELKSLLDPVVGQT
jgi:insertion element IS1 protein InsB